MAVLQSKLGMRYTLRRVAIVGLGLIGGSMGLALKKAQVKDLELVGFARRPEVASMSLSIGAVDRAEGDLISAVKDADLVLIATPAMAVREVLTQIGGSLPQGCIVTDIASTKAQVMAWAQELLPPSVAFIGGHPMAGKETFGIEAADADLFHGCVYCLIPGENASTEATNLVTELVKQIGANPLFLDALEHDSMVAAVSHLPLLLSAALVSTTMKSPSWSQMARLAATGFRDLTRLASGNPKMSGDICLTNKEPILRWIDEFITELGEFRRLISEEDKELEQTFLGAREQRERWLQQMKRERA
jgi:prephenate dehydrogenase